jgi:hypothetical protein
MKGRRFVLTDQLGRSNDHPNTTYGTPARKHCELVRRTRKLVEGVGLTAPVRIVMRKVRNEDHGPDWQVGSCPAGSLIRTLVCQRILTGGGTRSEGDSRQSRSPAKALASSNSSAVPSLSGQA